MTPTTDLAVRITEDSALTLYEREKMYYASTFLGENPEALDAAIALHYASMTALAMQMKALVEHRRSQRNDNCEQCIAYMREQIRQAHRHAFGTAPNWPTAARAGRTG